MAQLQVQYGWVKKPSLGLTRKQLEGKTDEQLRKYNELLQQFKGSVDANPLIDVYPVSANQHAYMASKAFIAAAFAGNRFGKSAANAILALVNCVPLAAVPPHLLQYRTYLEDTPFYARMGVPTLDKHAIGVMVPLLRRWVPTYTLVGGKWDSAWSNKLMLLEFKNGSFIEFRSYDQDVSAWSGASRHAIYMDELPTFEIYEEARWRLMEYPASRMRFALTPIGLSWAYDEIWKKRNEVTGRDGDDIEVFGGSIHDNVTLDEEQKKLALAGAHGAMREAREFGKFVSLEGRIYDAFDSGKHIVKNISPRDLESGTIYCSIDPGIRHPAALFARANSVLEQVLIFDEIKPMFASTMNIAIFCRMIHEKLVEWNLPIGRVRFMIDPAARIPDQKSGETLLTEYNRYKLYPQPALGGPGSVNVGIARKQQLIADNQWFITERCVQYADELEIASWATRAEGDMGTGDPKPEKTDKLHLVDCGRYLATDLPWFPAYEDKAPKPSPDSLAAILKPMVPNQIRQENAYIL